jgi:hypothetical protein
MTNDTRPPFVPHSTCRSETPTGAPVGAAARLERVRTGLQRRAQRTALQSDKIEVDCARFHNRIFVQRNRQEHPSAEMRAVNELRAEVAALAALAGITPWPPAKAAPVKGPRKSRARKRRRRG